jgi:hypothetical protein
MQQDLVIILYGSIYNQYKIVIYLYFAPSEFWHHVGF